MSNNIKTFKKGEFIFREGDKITSLMLIQSGSVSLCLCRPKRNIELGIVQTNATMGEMGINGVANFTYSGMATSETKIVEFPIEVFRQVVESSPQLLRLLVKTTLDKLKNFQSEIKTNRLEKEKYPCPEDQIARVFGSVYYSALKNGFKNAKNSSVTTVDWIQFKNYAQRIFGDSPKRLEQAVTILVKLKCAEFEMGKPAEEPDSPDQIMKAHFYNLASIENFFEFYQYNYFKNGKTDVIKAEDAPIGWLECIAKISEDVKPDSRNITQIEYPKVIEAFKNELNIQLNKDHFARLEAKGVFFKRVLQGTESVFLQFNRDEIKSILFSWKILREVDKWNEKGFVDLNEEVIALKKREKSKHGCPQCGQETSEVAKFCSECGYKIAA